MKKLERSLSLTTVIAIAIGGMLGSGLFVLPGLAAAKTGPSVWLAYLLAGLCVLPAALSKAELATAMPSSGGTYVFIERTFGPIMGTISGFGLWLSLLFKSSFALVGFGAYLLVLADVPLKATALFFLGLIMLLNMFGVKKVGKVQLIIVIISIAGLIPLVVTGLITLEPDNLVPALTNGNKGLFSAVAFVFVSYAGVTKVAAIAGEIRNPSRNLPLAMILALVVVTTIYVLVTFVLVGNISSDTLHEDIHPIYTLSKYLGGDIAGYAAAILGVVTLISMSNSGVLAASRFPFAMSRDKLLPAMMGKLHPKHLTPIVTIGLTCAVMAMVILFLDVEKIAKLASAFMVMMFTLVHICVIVLRETSVQWYNPPYRAPLYPWMQLFGILSGIVLLFYLGMVAILAFVIIFALGVGLYLIYGRKQTMRSGVLKVYGHRPALYLLYGNKKKKETNRTVNKKTVPDHNLDGAIASEANVVVPLFGKERSPEMLVEMGSAIANQQKVQVMHLTEIPEQTALDDVLQDDAVIASLNRRISAMAQERAVDVDFDAAVTHDLMSTIYTVSDRTHCQWLVMGWDGRARNGLLVSNPIGWLVSHVNSDFALFKDKGIRYIRRILVSMRPGRNDAAFIQLADQIAQFYGADVTLLRILSPDADKEVVAKLERASNELIQHSKSKSKSIIIKSEDPLKAIADASAGYDLLIAGTPREDNWLRVLFGTRDKFVESAACSVLRITLHR